MSNKGKIHGGRQSGRDGVLICGAYGLGNAGDEAILEAIVGEMRAIDADMPITVISRRPDETAERLKVESVHTFDLLGFLRAMRRSALYINGGGSLIQDVTSRRSLWYYLFSIAAAKILGCSVIMYGCGIGPVLFPYNRRLVRRVLNRFVDTITLREESSLQELRNFGVTKPETILSSDPALSLPEADADEVERCMLDLGLTPGGNYAVFMLRRWKGFNERAEHFADAARYLYETYNLTPVFLSINHQNDGEATDMAVKDLSGIPTVIIREPMSTGLAIGLIARMRVAVSMRLHGLIFAESRGVPTIGIGYDPKVVAFLDYIGNDLYLRLEDVTAEALRPLLDEAMRRERSMARVEELRVVEQRNVDAARRLLI